MSNNILHIEKLIYRWKKMADEYDKEGKEITERNFTGDYQYFDVTHLYAYSKILRDCANELKKKLDEPEPGQP